MAFRASSGDVQFDLTRHGLGDVESSVTWPDDGFSPGKLQDILRWKMKMAEDLQRAQLAELRERARERAQERQYQAQERKSMQQGLEPQAVNRPQSDPNYAKLADYLNIGGTGMVPIGREDPDALQEWLKWMGPGRVHEGLMQTGRIMGSSGGHRGSSANAPRNTSTAMRNLIDPYRMPLSRKTGGGIPKDGWYYLHADEEVIPAPKTLKDMMLGKMVRDSGPKGKRPNRKPKKSESYQTGTLDSTDIIEALMAPMAPEDLDRRREILLQSPEEAQQAFMEEYNIPGGPTSPETDPEVEMAEQRRQIVADPDVDMQQALAALASERSRFGEKGRKEDQGEAGLPPRPSAMGIEGLSVSEAPLSERQQTSTLRGQELYNRPEAPEGQETVKQYTLDQSPRNEQEQQARQAEAQMQELEQEKQEIERLNEAAYSHSQAASKLMEYASQNQGTPVYEALRQQAADRLAMAQQMERMASQRAKMIEARQQKLAELQAGLTAAQIEAGGRTGAAEATARGRIAGGQAAQQTAILNNLRSLAEAFGGIEGGDPETQEAMIQQMMQLFLMLGGLQEAFGGGLPNG